MTGQPIRPGDVAAAALVIGGSLVMAFPQHAVSILHLVIVTVSVVAGLHALAVNVPPTGWLSPFKWMSPFGRAAGPGKKGDGPDEIKSIHWKLSGWRQPIRSGPPMPPETLRLLRPLLRAALDLDPGDEAHLASARNVLSPLSWAVLTSDHGRRPPWFRKLPPGKREVAEAVHAVLDEIDRIADGAVDSGAPFDTNQRREQ